MRKSDKGRPTAKASLEIRREGSQCFDNDRRAMGVPHSYYKSDSSLSPVGLETP